MGNRKSTVTFVKEGDADIVINGANGLIDFNGSVKIKVVGEIPYCQATETILSKIKYGGHNKIVE